MPMSRDEILARFGKTKDEGLAILPLFDLPGVIECSKIVATIVGFAKDGTCGDACATLPPELLPPLP